MHLDKIAVILPIKVVLISWAFKAFGNDPQLKAKIMQGLACKRFGHFQSWYTSEHLLRPEKEAISKFDRRLPANGVLPWIFPSRCAPNFQ